jgi:hypothetical protein
LVFGEGRGSSSFSHPFCHWNYFLRLFYLIENTVVIPVTNLKIGYEFTVLSLGERVEKSAEAVQNRANLLTLSGPCRDVP